MTADATLTYPSYLQLDKILDAQAPVAPASLGGSITAGEQFFIVVHQAFELWFKQVLADFECARQALLTEPRDAELALDHLQRVAAIERLLIQQWLLFDHLSLPNFLAFRPYLGTASGSESRQWHEVQRVLGLRGHHSPIYEALSAAIAAAGWSLLDIYRDPSRAGVLYRLAEALVDISNLFWQLTAAHVQVAERAIGDRPGTGGTSGVPYLREALQVKAFPELWSVRSEL